MKKIIVPIDFSSDSINALEFAITFANIIGTEIRMVHVKKSKNFEVPFYFKDFAMSVNKSLDDFMKILIDKYKPMVKNRIDYKIREGSIYKEITNQAKYDDAYMVIMGTHGVSGFEELWIGSNAFRVVSKTPCPVITLRNGFVNKATHKIVMPIDMSFDSRKKVPYVTELALSLNATVSILGVTEINASDIITKLTTYCSQVEEYMKDKGVKCSTKTLSGDNITDITIDFAKGINAELIAINIEQIANTAFWLGPYAQQMVNHSPIPVLSIPPKS